MIRQQYWYVMLAMVFVATVGATNENCGGTASDDVQRQQNEALLAEATAQTGMPAITNFRERKLLKDILEMRDQEGLTTYTYTFSEMTGELKFFCNSIGFAIPSATQYTNPQKSLYASGGSAVIAQADQNGLFSPASAEATYVVCKNPNGPEIGPIYVEPRIVTSPFKLH